MIKEIKRFVLGICATNCYVISDEDNNCVIVDCDKSYPVVEYIDSNGLKPALILLTHSHGDHISGVPSLKEKYGCKIGIGAIEQELLSDADKNLSSMINGPLEIEADEHYNDGDTIKVGKMEFKVMLTPGHTKGSVCFISEDIIISGDTLFAGSCGRTDFYSGSWTEILESLNKLVSLKGDYDVLPGHGETTKLSYERRTNPFINGQF